jgi:hypothetical protein
MKTNNVIYLNEVPRQTWVMYWAGKRYTGRNFRQTLERIKHDQQK